MITKLFELDFRTVELREETKMSLLYPKGKPEKLILMKKLVCMEKKCKFKV